MHGLITVVPAALPEIAYLQRRGHPLIQRLHYPMRDVRYIEQPHPVP
jgi:hypothetical protein